MQVLQVWWQGIHVIQVLSKQAVIDEDGIKPSSQGQEPTNVSLNVAYGVQLVHSINNNNKLKF